MKYIEGFLRDIPMILNWSTFEILKFRNSMVRRCPSSLMFLVKFSRQIWNWHFDRGLRMPHCIAVLRGYHPQSHFHLHKEAYAKKIKCLHCCVYFQENRIGHQ